jgi:hypothetical protein
MVFSIVKNLTTLNLGELFSQIALYYGFYYEYEFEFEYSDGDAGRAVNGGGALPEGGLQLHRSANPRTTSVEEHEGEGGAKYVQGAVLSPESLGG